MLRNITTKDAVIIKTSNVHLSLGKHVYEKYTSFSPNLYSETGVLQGISFFFDLKHRLLVLVRKASPVDEKKSQEKKSRKKVTEKSHKKKSHGEKVTIIKDQEKIHISVHKRTVVHDFHFKRKQ